MAARLLKVVEDPMSYLFGPINSERLGRSLGVDLIPHKICNFDCIYCECGRTTAKVNQRGSFVKLDLLLEEFDQYLSTQGEEGFDVVTLTGSGETTLESQLGRIVWAVRHRTSKPVAVLTNGSLMSDLTVQMDLALADIVLPSLDAAIPGVFQKVDQPMPWITVENVILGMIDFRNNYPNVQFWLEVLLVDGVNDQPEHLQVLKKAIEVIKPHRVHVMTVSRPPAYPGVRAVAQDRLREIQGYLCPENSDKESLGDVKDSKTSQEFGGKIPQRTDSENFFEVLKRRPCSLEDLIWITGLNQDQVQIKLKPFVENGLLKRMEHEGKYFYTYRRVQKTIS
jgi:wyosine [tRNA(Phe)-imidazoG37] synthetase (radical SAM superfamily)